MKKTLGMILGGKSFGVFKNREGEFCRISRYYIKNTCRYQVIFQKNVGDLATRYAINTASENKVLKLIGEEGFELICN